MFLLLGLEEEAFSLARQGGFLASLAMAAGLAVIVLCCEGSFESGWATKINQLINKINKIKLDYIDFFFINIINNVNFTITIYQWKHIIIKKSTKMIVYIKYYLKNTTYYELKKKKKNCKISKNWGNQSMLG